MFQNLNPLGRDTAILEILIMLGIAYLLGLLTAWLCTKACKRRLRDDLDACNARCKELESRPAQVVETTSPSPVATAPVKKSSGPKELTSIVDRLSVGGAVSDAKDDLQKINGIGPFIEEKLNKVGISTFDQIARFTDGDINIVEDAIEFFPGRMQRDDWKGQARKLMS